MKWYLYTLVVITSLIPPATTQASPAADTLIAEYRSQGASQFHAEKGKLFWNHSFKPGNASTSRSCASCHTLNPRQSGKHVRTGKKIKPLAPSTNPERLKDIKKVRKWFKRNCQWTLGRECTAQEKGNVLLYLRDL